MADERNVGYGFGFANDWIWWIIIIILIIIIFCPGFFGPVGGVGYGCKE